MTHIKAYFSMPWNAIKLADKPNKSDDLLSSTLLNQLSSRLKITAILWMAHNNHHIALLCRCLLYFTFFCLCARLKRFTRVQCYRIHNVKVSLFLERSIILRVSQSLKNFPKKLLCLEKFTQISIFVSLNVNSTSDNAVVYIKQHDTCNQLETCNANDTKMAVAYVKNSQRPVM